MFDVYVWISIHGILCLLIIVFLNKLIDLFFFKTKLKYIDSQDMTMVSSSSGTTIPSTKTTTTTTITTTPKNQPPVAPTSKYF